MNDYEFKRDEAAKKFAGDDLVDVVTFTAGADWNRNLTKEYAACVGSLSTQLDFTNFELKKTTDKLDIAIAALKQIALSDNPPYTAHPQSVWWITHVTPIAKRALAQIGVEK